MRIQPSSRRARTMRSFLEETLAPLVACGVVCAGCVETPCGPRLRCDPPAETADDLPPCPSEPEEGAVPEDRCGIFVSSSLGNDQNAGTREDPARTMARAIEMAAQEPQRGQRVYACRENFPEAVRVRGTVEIWGGFDCSQGWIYSGDGKNTVIEPEPDAVPLTFEPGSTSTVFDVEAWAASATEPGGSSIAAVALEGAAVRIHRSKLTAADGARGSDGMLAHPMNEPARAGTHGIFGQDACTGDFVPGADQVHSACEEHGSLGGRGGDGASDHGLPGRDGELMSIPNPSGLGLGGQGATGTEECLGGARGADGADGAHGLGARGLGTFDTQQGVYLGVNGGDGGNGLPGQGGGGGGGTQAGAIFCGSPRKIGGASGGSGGSGGCGGRGGRGGGHGGASLGLVIVNARVDLHGAEIQAARGGDGGHGGFFQIGGAPGLGAPGGQGFGGSPFGCSGGDGGKGGNGGHGGGGHGGPSIVIAYVGASPPGVTDAKLETGRGGNGGLGANPSVPGSAGEDGLALEVASLPQ
jgi:hypothetical protein